MLRRLTPSLSLVALAAVSNAQFLSGTSGSASYANASETIQYVPSSGGAVTAHTYFASSTGTPSANDFVTHNFSGLELPGVGGITSGGESASVIDSFVNGSVSASFSSTLSAQGSLATSLEGAGSNKDISGSTNGAARDNLMFTLSGATNFNISGLATFSGSGPLESVLWLTNQTTNATTYFELNHAGSFSQSMQLAAGQYSLTGFTVASPAFELTPYQGFTTDSQGTWSTQLNYTANFTPQTTPEPSTLFFGVFTSVQALRVARKRRARA